jgi:hypothetical protein
VRRAVVVGRAQGALEEYAAAVEMIAPHAFDEVIVVGRAVVGFPHPVHHMVTFHTNLVDKWCAERAARGHPPPENYWTSYHKGKPLKFTKASSRAEQFKYVTAEGGSSGRVAVHVSVVALNVDRTVLVGMPMTQEAGHFDQDGDWKEADLYWEAWAEDVVEFADRVRSMSGRTREAFGGPTREWLVGD